MNFHKGESHSSSSSSESSEENHHEEASDFGGKYARGQVKHHHYSKGNVASWIHGEGFNQVDYNKVDSHGKAPSKMWK